MATPITAQIRWASNTQELKTQIMAGTGSIIAMKDAVDKTSRSLGGEGLLRAAHNTTAAVQQLGGATKLTAAEKERINAQLTKAIDKYQVLGQQAPKAMLDLASATGKAEQSTTLADKAAGFLKSTFAQFTAANLAASAIQLVIGRMKEFVDVGIKLPAVEASFKRLTVGIGQDSGQMLAAMTGATKGMVSNYDLMLSANKAMLLGLPVTAGSMGNLASAATTLGRAMGLDATQSLNDLITALGRSSPMILDNLGLTVKVGEANTAYAAKLGKSAEQLTDAEKKMAFYEAAMVAAQKKTAELGDSTKTLGEVIATAWTTVGNSVSAGVGKANVGLGHALSSWKEFKQFVLDGGTSFVRVGEAIEKAAERATQRTKDIVLAVGAVAPATESYTAQLAKMKHEVAQLTSQQIAEITAAKTLGVTTDELTTKFGLSEGALKLVTESTKAATKATTELDAQGRKWINTLEEMRFAEIEAQQKFEKSAKHLDVMSLAFANNTGAMRGNANEAMGLTRDGLIPLNERMQDSIVKMGMFGNIVVAVNEKVSTSRSRMAEWRTSIGELSASFEQLATIAGGGLSSVARWLGTVTSSLDMASKGGDSLAVGLGQIGDGNMRQGLANTAAGIIGITSAFMAATNSGNAFKDAVGGAAVGAQLGAQFGGAWGAAVGAAIGGLAGLVRSIFGPSADERAGRSAAATFRNDLANSLTTAQKLEAGNDEWKKSVIAIRDAYMLVGRTEQDALDVSRRLWEAERHGPEAVERVIEEISRTLTTDFLPDSQQATAIAALGWRGVLDIIQQAKQATNGAGTAATNFGVQGSAAAQAMIREIDALIASTGDEGLRRELMALKDSIVLAAGQGVTDFARFAAEILRLRALISAPITLPTVNDPNHPVSTKPGDTAWVNQASDAQKRDAIARFKAGNMNANGSWDRHRIPSALGISLDEVTRLGFRTGTHGRLLDFGEGTDVTLHGREQIKTEGEVRSENSQLAKLAARLDAVAAEMRASRRAMRDDLFLAMRDGAAHARAR